MLVNNRKNNFVLIKSVIYDENFEIDKFQRLN